MRDLLSATSQSARLQVLGRLFIWTLFFASSVYGHVALKLAVKQGHQTYAQAMLTAGTSAWGWSAVAAWALSCVLWVLAISRQKLLIANSISSLSYVLICVASWLLLGERLTGQQFAGVTLIVAGILLVK